MCNCVHVSVARTWEMALRESISLQLSLVRAASSLPVAERNSASAFLASSSRMH